MSKTVPATPSFVAWQKAAAKLLTLETALAQRKRAVLPPEPLDVTIEEIESSLANARLVSDSLFRVAFAEASQHPESRNLRATKRRSRAEPHVNQAA